MVLAGIVGRVGAALFCSYVVSGRLRGPGRLDVVARCVVIAVDCFLFGFSSGVFLLLGLVDGLGVLEEV